jgi:hypothetical protein
MVRAEAWRMAKSTTDSVTSRPRKRKAGGRSAFTLFIDLDGVLADFDRGVEAVLGRRPDQVPTGIMWRALAQQPDFFGTLQCMADARQLWEFCRPYAPTILTGLPMGQWAPAQKRRWVASMLGTDVRVITCMSRDKPRYSGPGHILIDDREKVRDGWEAAGGIFIHHRSARQSIAALRRLGVDGTQRRPRRSSVRAA